MSTKRRIGVVTADSLDDIWQRRATAAAIVAVREVINGGTIPPNMPISKMSDVEIGWTFAAGLFAWIRTRSEQATSEGWNVDETLRRTSVNSEPWDEGAVASILPSLGDVRGVDWSKSLGAWSQNEIVRFLIQAMSLARHAMIARDVGGNVTTTKPKSLDEMQRIASAEAGGPLMTPDEFDDPIPF